MTNKFLDHLKQIKESGGNLNEPMDAAGLAFIPERNNTSTYLHAAVKNCNFEVLHYLLDNGFNVNVMDGEQKTALDRVIDLMWHKIEIYIYYGKERIPINRKDRDAVAKAAREGKYDFVNWTDNKNKSLLEMSKILLEHGARVTAEQKVFFTATLATIKIDACAYEESWESKCRIATYLTEGRDLDEQDNLGQTLLHKAVTAIKPSEVEILLQKGASLDIKDTNDKTPFQLMLDMIKHKEVLVNIDHKWKSICHLFLSYGARITPEEERDFMSMGINQRLAEHEWQTRNHRALNDIVIRNKELITEQQSLRELTGRLTSSVNGDIRRIDTTTNALTDDIDGLKEITAAISSSQDEHKTQFLALTGAVENDFIRQGGFIDDLSAQLNEQQQVIAAMHAQLLRQQEVIVALCQSQPILTGPQQPLLTEHVSSVESPRRAGGITFFNPSSRNDFVQIPRTEWEALKHKVTMLEHEVSSHNDSLQFIEGEIKLIHETGNMETRGAISSLS